MRTRRKGNPPALRWETSGGSSKIKARRNGLAIPAKARVCGDGHANRGRQQADDRKVTTGPVQKDKRGDTGLYRPPHTEESFAEARRLFSAEDVFVRQTQHAGLCKASDVLSTDHVVFGI